MFCHGVVLSLFIHNVVDKEMLAQFSAKDTYRCNHGWYCNSITLTKID